MEDYYYFDTDALVKLMLDEKGCIGVRSIYDNDNNVIICSAFSILEVVSALGQNKSAGYIYNGVYKDSLAYFNKIITINEEGKATIRVESNINLEQIECAKNLINKAWR